MVPRAECITLTEGPKIDPGVECSVDKGVSTTWAQSARAAKGASSELSHRRMLADPPRLIIPIFIGPAGVSIVLFLHMDMASDRLRTMLGSRRSAIAFCWASPHHTGSRALKEAPGAPGSGLGCESQASWWATQQRGQYQPQSGPISNRPVA